MITLSAISPSDLTEQDVKDLARLGQRTYDGTRGEDYVQMALEGKLGLFRIEGTMVGLIGLEFHPRRQLWISLITGKGAMAHAEEIRERLKEVQKILGAKSIGTMASGKALLRLYKKMGLVPKAYLFEEE